MDTARLFRPVDPNADTLDRLDGFDGLDAVGGAADRPASDDTRGRGRRLRPPIMGLNGIPSNGPALRLPFGPGTAPPTRWRIDRRTVGALVGLGFLGILVGVWFWWRAQPDVALAPTVAPAPAASAGGTSHHGHRVPAGESSSAAGPAADAPTPEASGILVIDVVGRVGRPGLLHLPAGSRVDDALQAAGGALPGVDLTPVNLARPLQDGEQIRIGIPGDPVGGGTGPSSGGECESAHASAAPSHSRKPSSGCAGPVNLNTATLEQLESLPGIGPSLAERILQWRTEHGSFSSLDQLRDVKGIGERKFAALQSEVRL